MDARLTGPLIGAGATLLAACIWVWGGKLTGDDKKPAPAGGGAEQQRLADERRKVEDERRALEDERRRLQQDAERRKLVEERKQLEAEKARLAEARRRPSPAPVKPPAPKPVPETPPAPVKRTDPKPSSDVPANFSGTWVSQFDEEFQMVQAGSQVQFRGVDDLGASVAGEGVVKGRKVEITYVRVDETSRSTGKASLTLSADGKRAEGTYTNTTFGQRGTMILKRR